MRRAECRREDELLAALQASRWPDTCEPSLREHVGTCASCADLLAVVAPLLHEQRVLAREAVVPSSAIVWWRAQMRSRREAAEKAAQPISFVQGIALACTAGLLATALGLFVPTFRKSFAWLRDAAGDWPGLAAPVGSDILASPITLAAIAALGICAIVAPIVLYFTFRED